MQSQSILHMFYLYFGYLRLSYQYMESFEMCIISQEWTDVDYYLLMVYKYTWVSFLIHFSNVFIINDVREMGLYFSTRLLSPFLNTGTTLPNFHSLGIYPLWKHSLKIRYRRYAIDSAQFILEFYHVFHQDQKLYWCHFFEKM